MSRKLPIAAALAAKPKFKETVWSATVLLLWVAAAIFVLFLWFAHGLAASENLPPTRDAPAADISAVLSDPEIRAFVGPSENDWDFNKPDSIPGFGSIPGAR